MMETTAKSPSVQNTGRLKYASPRDLPSYPSSGLRADGAAASAAASLGWSSQKAIEPWKPDKTSSASAAAVLAKNYKMAPAWEPSSTPAPTRAALLAVGSANSVNKSPATKNHQDGFGNSAATQAFNSSRTNSLKTIDYTKSTATPTSESQRSLAAAKGAMQVTRRRAISTPAQLPAKETYPGESMAASNALSGATLAHKASLKPKSPAEGAGAVPVTTMTRNMFTSHPPVKPEVDEQENNEKLHATAVAMARKMYTQQQKIVEQTKAAHGQETTEVKPYINLQEAAFKQAQERLAKLQDEHQKGRDYQEYYGNASSPRRRFSITKKLRRRASSDGDLDDREQSEKIRQQMSMFSDKLSKVDHKKRQQDRDAVLAAAQRNVKAQLLGMDKKVKDETGMVNPTMISEWEVRAHQTAQANSDSRNEHKGKIDLGAGKFMDPSEVDAIASRRVQPVLDDINEKAEVERERQTAARLEAEAKKAEEEKQKARDREIKDINRKIREQEKQEEKAKRKQEKLEEQARKDEEKALKAEQKRQAKDEKPKKPAVDTGVVTQEHGVDNDTEAHHETPTGEGAVDDMETGDGEQRKSSEPGTSPTSRVKGWIKNRFSRGKSVSEQDKPAEHRRSFLGGAALRESGLNRSTTSLDNRPTSMRDVALAGRSADPESTDKAAPQDSRGVSPVSSSDDEDDERPAGFESFGDATLTPLSPPRPIADSAARTSSSPTRDSRFRERFDQ